MRIASIVIIALTLAAGCQNRRETSQSMRLDSARPDSSGSQMLGAGKPAPPIPVEEMNKDERKAYKDTLERTGYYDCCTKPSCNMCLYDDEECHCGKNVKEDKAVCGECYKRWQKGEGNIKGIDPTHVKRM